MQGSQDKHDFEVPSTPNADEYTYVVKSGGFFRTPSCSLNQNGEKCADLIGPLASSGVQTLGVTWVSGEVWSIEQHVDYARKLTDSKKVLSRYVVMAPEGVRARMEWMDPFSPIKLEVTGSLQAELFLQGTHLQLWLDDVLAGEATPVWRDSDTVAGVEARVFLDRNRADARACALLLLGVGLADRDNMEFSQSLGTKPG